MSLRPRAVFLFTVIGLASGLAACGRSKCADVACVEPAPGTGGTGLGALGGKTGATGGITGEAGAAGATAGAGGAAGSPAGGAGGAVGGAGGTSGAGGATPLACLPPASTKCVQPAPSFATTITPILDRSCNTCHSDDNPDGIWPLNAWADVSAWQQLIITDLVNCTMPPADSNTPFPESDRQLFFAWLACGSPDN